MESKEQLEVRLDQNMSNLLTQERLAQKLANRIVSEGHLLAIELTEVSDQIKDTLKKNDLLLMELGLI